MVGQERRALELTIEGRNEWSEITPDPYIGTSHFHPNPTEPMTATWRMIDTLVNHSLIVSGEVAMAYQPWQGECILHVEIEQADRKTARDFVIRGGEAPTRWGLVYDNDGLPFNLKMTVTLGEGCDLANSLVAIGPLQIVQPIHEGSRLKLFKVYSADDGANNRALINANQGGMMNRLVSLFSLVAVAKQTGRDAYVWWGPNAHCAANFNDLFETSEEVDPSFLADNYEIYTFYDQNTPPIDLTTCKRNVIIHSVSPIRTEPAYPCGFIEIADEFRQTPYSRPVMDLLSQFDDVDFSRTIAFHIRRPFPNGAFAELENSKFKLGLDVFTNLIAGLRREFHDYDRVLVCTNNFDVENEISETFGDYAFFFKKTTIDNTTDPRAVQEAIVDLTLMSRCPILFSQETTVFGLFAHVLGHNQMLDIRRESTPAEIRFYHRRVGRNAEDLLIPTADLSELKAHIEDRVGA